MNDDLIFSYVDIDGRDVKCRIVSSIPKNADEIYVLFMDEEDVSENTELKYGIVVRNGDEYELKAGVDDNSLEELKNVFYDDLYKLAESIIGN